ncbi:MAG: ATP-binding protein [Paracoccaceae bacterium]
MAATKWHDCAAILDALPDAAFLVGPDRRIAAANAAAQDLFAAPLTGAMALSYLRQPEAAAVLDRAFGWLQGHCARDVRLSAQIRRPGPTTDTILSFSVAPVFEDGQVGALLVVLSDTTLIEVAEQQRRDFVANVSHELRSPLTALAGFIETLQGPARDDAGARETFLSIMRREADRMSRLVADLLSLSRVESQERVRPRDRIAPADIVAATVAALAPQAGDASIDLRVEDGVQGAVVLGDRDQLVQVMHNLVENAMKYGGAGKTVRIALSREPGPPAMIRMAVHDQGEGIDPTHLPRLTERFYRVDGHRSREMGGTGLGLAIVKHIVNRHRGRLVITSDIGKGSCFAVVLPEAVGAGSAPAVT